MTPEFIQSLPSWEYFTQRLGAASVVALSLEDSSMRSYRSRVCLLVLHARMADGESVVGVVDALAFEGARPNPLARLAETIPRETPVIVHGGEYAMAGLRREYHVVFDEVWDTQQAAVLLGLEQTGYRNLCASLLGERVEPAPSVDWRLRPVAEDALGAAMDDVRHLPELWSVLRERIGAAELVDEWRVAGRAVAATPAHANLVGHETIWHLKEARALPPERVPLLESLIGWRDRKAREFDCPPGKVVPGPQLCRIAATADLERLDGLLSGFHSRLLWSDREEVRRLCLGHGGEAGPVVASAARVPNVPPSRQEKLRLQRLKEWRRTEAERRGVGLQAVLPAEAMAFLARHGVAGMARAPMFGEGRMAKYGSELAELLGAETT